MNRFSRIFPKINPSSLRVRLTIGIAVFSALGLGGLTTWTGWKMQQLLINSHKENMEQIASRLPLDVEVYSQMLPFTTALEKAISNRETNNTLLWITNTNNTLLAKSSNFNPSSDTYANELINLTKMPLVPEVYHIKGHSYVLCGGELKIRGKVLGKVSIAQDITRDQAMFVAMIQSMGIATILVIILISGGIAFYVSYSLQPLRQISRMTEAVQAEDLGEARLYLNNAPSEVKELAQTVNMMLSRLADAWEKERQFTSNISHELRTSLTIVHGYLQSILRRQQNLTEIQKEALLTAASEAERTIHILQDLLDLARADSGYLQLSKEPCILDDIVTEIVSMAQQNSSREITIEIENNPITIKADSNRIKQILLNLIDNAVKYSDPDTPINVNLHQIKNQVIIQICDKGYGIPLQNQSHIFERFYRVDTARTHSNGTGLGLSIAKTLVEKMGGSISVRSKLGEGSVFTVSLPC
ncbi:sensor histidine kinase [Brunnivagina elsteri]|uniref:histidine kinase n=1 Tax=Brunnivagina elsteri CCALA 953 TaxID=987040 RepID=A0A2A2THR7_9CYAN|nr:HAMP domain-containing sensor histidine kinase [Calothrix elsteri]PAX53175.1 two-component sensor histidine kinase [Calothrix elsteri CCALA 953]